MHIKHPAYRGQFVYFSYIGWDSSTITFLFQISSSFLLYLIILLKKNLKIASFGSNIHLNRTIFMDNFNFSDVQI